MKILLLLLTGLFFFPALEAQTEAEGFQSFDRRWITHNYKRIQEVHIGGIYVQDELSSSQEPIGGNMDSTSNYGWALSYNYLIADKNRGGYSAGIGYEYYPGQYQKVIGTLEYLSLKVLIDPNLPANLYIFSGLGIVFAQSLENKSKDIQWRLRIAELQIENFSLDFMLNNVNPNNSWDQGYTYLHLKYKFRPRKW